MEWFIEKEVDLQEVAEVLINNFLLKERTRALVFGLYGNLGAGKTTFTKYLVSVLGGVDSVISPTFILERDYSLSNIFGIKTLAHIDAYRFDDENEAEVLKIHSRLNDPTLVYVIEWPEKMGKHMPDHIQIHFEHRGGDTRRVTIKNI